MRIALLMIGLVACSNDDSGGPFAPIDKLDAVYQQSYCQRLVTCGEFPDLATCLSANIGGFPVQLSAPAANSDVVAAVLAGLVIYNGTKMQACIDALAATSCDPTSREARIPPAVCTETLRGTVAGGGMCHLSAECISQMCNVPVCESGCCAGTCVGDTPPVTTTGTIAVGEPCDFETLDPCVDGAFCREGVGICQPLEDEGSTCMEAQECDYGLSCAGESGLTCQSLPALGEPCPQLQCRDEGTVCSTMTMTCVAVGLPPAPCAGPADCSAYYQCDPLSNRCIPTQHVGESCATLARCFDLGTYCDSSTQLCTMRVANGQPCLGNEECISGVCDVMDTVGVCVAATACI